MSSSSSSSASSSVAVECHRFFAISKRVPKDVKRFCGICRQHGKLEETRGHVCQFKNCECPKCDLVRSRRLVMSRQIRLRRAQDKRFQRTTEPDEADVVPLLSSAASAGESSQSEEQKTKNGPAEEQQLMLEARNMCYFCQKCKNHGILVWKKHHKRQCPFTDCTCDFCELIETRRRLDQNIKRRKSAPQDNILGGMDDGGDDDEGEPPRKKSTASLPAQIEAMSCSDNENAVEKNDSHRIASRASSGLLGADLSGPKQQNGDDTAEREQGSLSLCSSPNLVANPPAPFVPQLVPSSSSSCSPVAPSLDSLQQLLSRSLLSSPSCAPFGPSLVVPPPNELLVPSTSLFLPSTYSSCSAAVAPSHQQNGLLSDSSSVLAQLLLLQASAPSPVAFLPEGDSQQKAFLVQILSKMVQEQQHNEQQKALLLQSHVQMPWSDDTLGNSTALAAILNSGTDNSHAVLQQQTDPSLVAEILLQQQHQQQSIATGTSSNDTSNSSSLIPLLSSAFRAVQHQQNGFQQML